LVTVSSAPALSTFQQLLRELFQTDDADFDFGFVIKGHNSDGTGVVIVWRDVAGLDPAVERAFLEPRLADEPPGERLINADSALTGSRSLDLTFKQLLEQEDI